MKRYSCRHAALDLRGAALAVVVALGHDLSIAQSQAFITDVRYPSRLAQLVSGPTGYYETPEAAWAAFLDSRTNPEEVNENFRPCANNEAENQWGYDYGQPFDWCHDYKIIRNGEVITSRIVSYVSMTERCPESYEQANWSPLRGRGNGGDAYIFERRCEKKKVIHHPKSCGMGNPVYPAQGTKRQVEIDYVDPLGRLDFSRTYGSDRGTFTHSMAASFIAPVNGAISGCETARITVEGGEWRTVCSARLGYQTTSASFVDQAGARYSFSWNGSTASAIEKYNNDRLMSAVVDSQAGWLVSRSEEGRLLFFDAQGRLKNIFIGHGGQVRLSYSSAAIEGQAPAADFLIAAEDDFGRRLQFFYGSTGLMERVVIPDGQSINYVNEYVGGSQWRDHASVAKTKSVTYPGSATKSYIWDEPDHMVGATVPNRLTGVVDENLDRYATFKYSDGRALSTEHAGAVNRFVMSDSRVNGVGTVSVTDPKDAVRQLTYGLADGMSRLMSRNQPAGSGCESSTSSLGYDARGNVISRLDFVGNLSCHAHASDRNVEEVRVEGLGEADLAVCSGNLTTYQVSNADPKRPQRKITTQWHPQWKLETRRAEPRLITTTVYNGRPDPIRGDTPDCAAGAPLLPDGVSKIAVVCRRYEQSTGDETGNLGFNASEIDKRSWSYSYNSYGQIKTEIGPRGQQSYEYWPAPTAFTGDVGHWQGDLSKVTNALGQDTFYLEYNKRGQVLKIQHPNGSIEQREYWPRGWLKSVTLTPAGSGTPEVTEYTYYATGLLKKATQPDGSWTFYTWDAAHRLINVKDSADNTVDYVLDGLGNRESETYKGPQDALAKAITRTFDALGRMDSSKVAQ